MYRRQDMFPDSLVNRPQCTRTATRAKVGTSAHKTFQHTPAYTCTWQIRCMYRVLNIRCLHRLFPSP